MTLRDPSILPSKCIDIARRIASGEVSAEQGSHEILDLVHEERINASTSMADTLIRRVQVTA